MTTSKSGRVVQGGSLRYCSLRRRGFEPHPLHFYAGREKRGTEEEVKHEKEGKQKKRSNKKEG